MTGLAFLKKRSWIGLDVGTRSIKALRLARKGKRVILEGFYYHDLAEKNDQFPENCDVGERLSALVEIHELGGAKTFANLPDNQVTTMQINLPPLPAKEIESAVRNEVENRLEFPLAEASLDFVCEKDATEKSNKLVVRAYSVRRERVEQRILQVTESNLSAESLESDMLAINEMLKFNGYFEDCANAVVVNLGESLSSVAHVQNGVLGTVNCTESGGAKLHAQLTEALDLSYDEADALVLSHGRTGELSHGRTGESSHGRTGEQSVEKASAAHEIIVNHWGELISEIGSSLQYFKELSFAKEPEKIFVVGGPGADPNFIKLIKESFDLEAIAVDPFRAIDIYKSGDDYDPLLPKVAPLMGVAVGLALRGL